MNDIINDTKARILKTAVNLFANEGFAGASIRKIASEADVNIAAINYHFRTKENLLFESFLHSYEVLRNEVNSIQENNSPVAFILSIYDLLTENNPNVINGLRLVIQLDQQNQESRHKKVLVNETFGYPGSEKFIALVNKERQNPISHEDALWLCQVIFSFIIHNAFNLVCMIKFFESVEIAFDSKKDTREQLKRTVETLLYQ